MAKPIKPGTDNQRPGTYVEVGPRGGKVDDSRIPTLIPVTDCRLRRSPVTVGRKSE